jgi:glycosyltransferase involved in cell wall biosynthesis
MGYSAPVLTAAPKADVLANGWVLHVVAANGGGVDRYVRDICAHRSHDCILHTVPEQCVFEAVTAHRFIPIDYERLATLSAISAFGHPLLLHAHSSLAPVRDYVVLMSKLLAIDYVLTLHDIDFAGAFGTVDDDERQARLEFVRKAKQRIVPSAFISRMLSAALEHEITRELIENGVDRVDVGIESAQLVDTTEQFQIAVVGALGIHKGLNFLREVVAALPQEVRVIVIGYADGQITPGWLQQDRIWVHGAFEPRDLGGLVRGYGARIAFFPNRQLESYSYALSDTWCAGVPALGPTEGAIGERILRSGAGWTYDAKSGADVVAARLLGCVTESDSLATYVEETVSALPSTSDMVRRLNEQYEKVMRTDQTPRSEAGAYAKMKALEAVAATHLDGHFFRSELAKLSGDLVFSQAQVANTERALQSLTQEYGARGVWIASLENALAECRAEITRVEAARLVEHEQAEAARVNDRMLSEAARQQDRDLANAARQAELAEQSAQTESARVAAHAAHELYAAKLQQDILDTLDIAHQQQHTIAVYERALSMIPPLLRRQMLARAERLAAVKAT